MDQALILAYLDELTRRAEARKARCDGLFSATMGGAAIDFMTTAERSERHHLMLQLPTLAEDREAARVRIQSRIAARRGVAAHA